MSSDKHDSSNLSMPTNSNGGYMNIYLLVNSVRNGTVTMDTMISGVEAKDFDEAKEKIKKMPKVPDEKEWSINEKSISFNVEQDDGSIFKVYCEMKNEPLKIIN